MTIAQIIMAVAIILFLIVPMVMSVMRSLSKTAALRVEREAQDKKLRAFKSELEKSKKELRGLLNGLTPAGRGKIS